MQKSPTSPTKEPYIAYEGALNQLEQVESMLRELKSDTAQQLGALRDDVSGIQSKLDEQVRGVAKVLQWCCRGVAACCAMMSPAYI